jgi:hypothetical protein
MARLHNSGTVLAMTKSRIAGVNWVHLWIPDKPQKSARAIEIAATKSIGPLKITERKARIG